MTKRGMRQMVGELVFAMILLVSCTAPTVVPESAPTLVASVVDAQVASESQGSASTTPTQDIPTLVPDMTAAQKPIANIAERADLYKKWLRQVQPGDAPVIRYVTYKVSAASASEPNYEFQLATDLRLGPWEAHLGSMHDRGINLPEMLLVKMAQLLEIPLGLATIRFEGNCFTVSAKFLGDGQLTSAIQVTCPDLSPVQASVPTTEPDLSTLVQTETEISETELDQSLLPINEEIPVDHSSAVLQRAAASTKDYFRQLGGRIDPVREESGYLQYVVRGLRGRVIDGSLLWEKLQIILLLQEREGQFTLRLIVDGYVASGLREPADTAYSDMGADYYAQLSQFAELLLTNIASSLK